jgi:hypothetical protein
MSDRLLTLAWRTTEHFLIRDFVGGGTVQPVRESEGGDAFIWRLGRADVVLRRDGDAWLVVCSCVSRLLGPRQVLYSAHHRRSDHAAWDVMARVIRLTRDENQGLEAGFEAARWIRSTGIGDEAIGYLH